MQCPTVNYLKLISITTWQKRPSYEIFKIDRSLTLTYVVNFFPRLSPLRKCLIFLQNFIVFKLKFCCKVRFPEFAPDEHLVLSPHGFGVHGSVSLHRTLTVHQTQVLNSFKVIIKLLREHQQLWQILV